MQVVNFRRNVIRFFLVNKKSPVYKAGGKMYVIRFELYSHMPVPVAC